MNVCKQPGCDNIFEPVIRGGRNVRMWCSEHAGRTKRDGKWVTSTRFKYNSNCSECGQVFKHADSRYETHRCPVCRLEVPARLKMEKQKAEDAQKKYAKRKSLSIKLLATSNGTTGKSVFISGFCVICGNDFCGKANGAGSPVTCSELCQKRRNQSKKKRRGAEYPHWSVVAKHYNSMNCWICGDITDAKDYLKGEHFTAGPNYPSVDHIVPVSNGGLGEISNLRVAHMICNSLRGTTPAELVSA